MQKNRMSREWVTPLTIGSFVLMAVTGVLMFFHLDSGLNKLAHEWLGWIMIAAVGLHALVNGLAFKRHLFQSRTGRGIVVASVVVLVASFVSLPAIGEQQASAPGLAIQAVTRAPLAQVAALTGKPVEQVLTDLTAAGLPAMTADQSLASVLGKDRAKIGQALNALFGKR